MASLGARPGAARSATGSRAASRTRPESGLRNPSAHSTVVVLPCGGHRPDRPRIQPGGTLSGELRLSGGESENRGVLFSVPVSSETPISEISGPATADLRAGHLDGCARTCRFSAGHDDAPRTDRPGEIDRWLGALTCGDS
ncbi:hypothetical protein [Nonomuraea sp. PA05]|uniref:hypothetical protein n=1 Tax=Nonomuraea sp. PA05 TaxID=2604466 RepID=UPI001651B9F1